MTACRMLLGLGLVKSDDWVFIDLSVCKGDSKELSAIPVKMFFLWSVCLILCTLAVPDLPIKNDNDLLTGLVAGLNGA